MVETDILRAELERSFDLDELLALSREILGFDPDAVGGTGTKASFAGALIAHCVDHEAVEALCDALLATRQDVAGEIADIRASGLGFDDSLDDDATFGPFSALRKLGEGRLATSYAGERNGRAYRIKVLRREATRDRRGLQRFLTVTRLVAGVDHPNLPSRLEAGEIGGRYYAAHEHAEGRTLAEILARSGPMHCKDALPVLNAVLAALSALHDKRIAHGDLRLENVLVCEPGDARSAVLLDVGYDRLRARPRVHAMRSELFSSASSPRTVSPEQIRGMPADPRSDVYSFGAMLYEVLSGKPPFAAADALEAAFGHLSRLPAPPSQLAPRGFISSRTDELVLELLSKNPEERPADAGAVRRLLDDLDAEADAARDSLSPETLDSLLQRLLGDASDEDAALALEDAAENPAFAERVTSAFSIAAEQLGADQLEAKKSLLFRCARVHARRPETRAQAEQVYVAMLELAPDDEVARAALMELRRRLGKFEELVEMLLAQGEQVQTRGERARVFAEIGRVYARDLRDPEQALVAFTQAFCEEPADPEPIQEIERLAGSNPEAWAEILSSCAAAAEDASAPSEQRARILNRAGRWWLDKAQRLDLGLSCFQQALALEPSNDTALEGLVQIYRKAQQWQELGMVLVRRADAAPTPARGRDYRVEAAEILDTYLGDAAGARALYEEIVEQDPAHVKALTLLGKLYERLGDHAALLRVLERSAATQRPDERAKTLCRIAETQEIQLNDVAEAERRYNAALDQDPRSFEALRGLDRLYTRGGRFQDLLGNLARQLELSATPRQKIAIFERMAAIHEEEFFDHQKAALALENVLEFDPAHESALVALARHYRATNRWEDVVAVYDRHLKQVSVPAERMALLLQQARVLADQIGSPERAIRTFEQVLALDPAHPEALEALAKLRELSGDAGAAVTAIEALANQAATPEAKAEQWIRAARLLDGRGDKDGAIDRYQRALDANPKDAIASAGLRDAYAARGNAQSAIQLLEREIEHAEGALAKAKLSGRMAALYLGQLRDAGRAEETAKRALGLDATNVDALTVLADVAFDAKRFLEASKYYSGVADRAESLERAEATRLLVRYVDALAQTGSTEQALRPVATLLRIAPDDAQALLRVAQVTFEHGGSEQALPLYQDVLRRFADQLSVADRATALYRVGESLRLADKLSEAVAPLEEAADLDPLRPEPLVALAKVYGAGERWADVLKVKTRHLDIASGEERTELLVELGDIAATKLGDRTQAAKSLVAALDERPDDRRLLGKLMQLYSEEKDWNKLVEVVLRLAEFVDDPKQKVKYLHTAAIVTAQQIGDARQALEFYERVLELDPSFTRAVDESTELLDELGDHQGVERLLKRRLEMATSANDLPSMIAAFEALGKLYEAKLGWTDQAVDAYEAAHTLDPDNQARSELLRRIYASDPARYLDKAVAAELELLRKNPYRTDSYKALRRVYTETKQADAAWCLCQALSVLNLAEPDEERFYKRMRSDTAAPAQNALDDDDWLMHIMHADADPLLTSVFALIEPAVIATRSQSLRELGIESSWLVQLSEHPAPVCQSLFYAAGVLGVPPPPTYQNPNDRGGVSLLFAPEPSLVLGVTGLRQDVPLQPAAFIAARQLAFLRSGMYVRHLLDSGTALKAWLFAAIKLTSPQFPVAAELEGSVREALSALEAGIRGQGRDHLTRVVAKLLTSGAALDLKRWVGGVDLTADRAGFVIAHDLETAVQLIRASGDSGAALPVDERIRELALYSVSPSYFHVRSRLGVGIDS